MSGLFDMLRGLNQPSGGTNCKALLFQAFNAWVHGEDPKSFLGRMADEVPELKTVNLGDLQGEAQKLCKQKGTTMEEVAKKAESMVPPEALK